MAFFLLISVALCAFVFYRYKQYQRQREIEEMAADAQAYVSSEVVELLQRYKTIHQQYPEAVQNPDVQKVYQKIKLLAEEMFCHTDSEQSVREYLSDAKQEIVLIKLALDNINPNTASHDHAFEDLK